MDFKSGNIYIIGKIGGTSRTQNFIKYFLDNKAEVYFDSFKRIGSNRKMSRKISGKVIVFFGSKISRLSSIYKIWCSDMVILPAMANSYQEDLKWAKKFGKKIITDFYISIFDTRVLDKKEFAVNSKRALSLKQSDQNCIKKADLVFFLNSTEANYYLEILDLSFNSEKHKIVPLCIEETVKCELNYFFDSAKIHIFKICWWGTYIPLHGLEKIIEAAALLKRDYKINFHLYLFGTTDEKAKPYKALIDELDVNNDVTLINNYTFSNGKLGDFLFNNCDLVLGNFGDSQKAKNVIVNKLIDGVAMKAPVLTGESTAPFEFFSENELYFTKNSPHDIAQSIYYISLEKPEEIKNRVDNAYNIFLNNFSISAYRNKLQKIFEASHKTKFS